MSLLDSLLQNAEGAVTSNPLVKLFEGETKAVSKTPQVKNLAASPLGQLLTGHPGNAIPTLINNTRNYGDQARLASIFATQASQGKKLAPTQQDVVNNYQKGIIGAVIGGVKGLDMANPESIMGGAVDESNNSWSPYVKNPNGAGVIDNPNYLKGEAQNPAQYTQNAQSPAASQGLNPEGKINPELGQNSPPPEVVQPKGTSEPYPYAKTPGKLSPGMDQETRKIVLKPDVNGAQDEAQINDTLNRLGIKGSAEAQYARLGPAMKDLNDNVIKPELENNPQQLSISGIMNKVNDNMKNFFRTNPDEKTSAMGAYEGYLNDLRQAAGDSSNHIAIDPKTGLPTGNIADNIPSSTVYKMLKITNADSNSIYKTLDNGGSLSPTQKVTKAFGDALRNAIKTAHPNIAQATQDMSDLFDAAPSLAKSRFSPPPAPLGFLQKAGNTLKNPAISIPLGFLGIAEGGNIGKAAGNMAGLAGVLGQQAVSNPAVSSVLSYLSHPLGQPPQSTQAATPATTAKPTSTATQNPDRYSVSTDPIKSGMLLDTQTYSDQKGLLQKKYDADSLNNPNAAVVDKGQLDALDTQWNGQSQLRDIWTNPVNGVSNVLKNGNQAAQAIQKADPGFFNALNQGYDSLQTASNGKYANMSGILKGLHTATGIDFTQYKSKEALIGALDSAMSKYKNVWDTVLQQYQGAGNQGGQGQNPLNKILGAPQDAPTKPIQYPQGGFNNTGNVRMNF